MHLEEILHQLEESKELEDWEMVDECIESIRVLIDDFDEYQNEEEWGWLGNRQVLFDNMVQRSLSKTHYKRLNNQNGDNSLVGLVIDWHLAEYDVPADVSTASVLDTDLAYQPTYAYA